jgi:hypothetical protein
MLNVKGTPVLLRQLRVLNWHSIYDRTIDVPDSGLLIFGTNGSGKTSLQDALQYALFPDLSSIRFNTAVADSARDRNLLGYVLQKIEDDAQGRPAYAHEERTSYVAIAFERGRERVVFVVGVEGRRADMSHEKVLASLVGTYDLRELPFLDEGRLPTPIKSFEKWVRTRGGHIHDRVASYIGEVSAFNGSPNKDWPQLLKSSIGFKEIRDATTFVRRFLAEQSIDHKTLLQTFQSYEDLRRTAEKTGDWIRLLADAVGPTTGEGGKRLPMEQWPALARFRHYRDRAMMYRVGEAHLPVRIAALELGEKRHTYDAGLRQKDEATHREQELETQLQTTRESHRALEEELRGRGVLAAIENLEDDIRGARQAVDDAEAAGGSVAQYRAAMGPLYGLIVGADAQWALRENALPRDLLLLQKDGKHRLVDFAEGSGDIHLHTADRIHRMVDEAEPEFGRAMTRLADLERGLTGRQQALEEERAQLHRGRPAYPRGIEATRALLRDRLGWTDARPLAEMLEVAEADDLWREAVEAELGWARYHFVVPAELYRDAQALYEQYREKGYRNDAGRTEPLYNASVVDIAKLREKRANRADRGSLAEKVRAECDDAEDYVKYELGHVICMTDSRRLREHGRAITPDLVFYRGFRVSSHDPAKVDLCVGAAARARRLARVEEELGRVSRERDQLQQVGATLSQAYRILRAALQQYERFREQVQVYRELEVRRTRLRELQEHLALLRGSEHREKLERRDALLREIQTLETDFVKAAGLVDSLARQLKALDNQIRRDSDEMSELDELAFEKLASFDVEHRERGIEAFEQELESRRAAGGGTSAALLQEFLRTCSRQTNENDLFANRARDQFADVAGRYRQETGFLANATVEHPEPLLAERERLIETALPEQKRKLEAKAREMREGVVQNVLHSLGARFQEMDRLLEEINRSTTQVETRFGHFKLVPRVKPEYESTRNLVKQALGVLNFEQLDAESEFYRQIEGFMQKLIDEPAKRDEYCDYRSYFDFEVHNRPIGGKDYTPFRGTRAGSSGGERQVPFYVMTMALMDYLYKRGVRANQFVGRLLLMDEVFHNMSDDNVDDVMNLAARLGLQIIMVTPGKLRTLAPRFGKTVQVAKRVVSPSEPTRFSEYTIENLPSDLLDFAEYEEKANAVA